MLIVGKSILKGEKEEEEKTPFVIVLPYHPFT